MIEFRKAVLAAAVVAAAASLGACGAHDGLGGPHGIRGDRGLPPSPAHLAYPNFGQDPRDAGRRLKTKEEQRRLQAELEARKPQRR